MPSTGGFDVVTQLRGDVLTDMLIRLLGDASTQDPTSSNYVARQLIYPPAPLEPQVMLWWDDPKVTLRDGEHATLSVALTGGVRQAASALDSGRIGSVSGTLTASMRPLLATTAGTPHLALALDALDLHGLRIKYGESNALSLVGAGGTPAPLGEAIVEALARDVLASAMVDALLRSLLTGLGRLPLVYSTALSTAETARTGAALRVFGERDGSVIAIGTPLPGMTGDLGHVENALAGRTDSNVAMTVTSVAVTAGTMRLLTTGKVARQLRAPNGAEARLDSLGVQAHDGYVTLTAHLSSGPVSGTALLNATLTLDRAAASLQLGVSGARVELDTLRAGSADEAAQRGQAAVQTVTGSLGAAFWGETLAALLGARYHEGALELAPVLSVPGSGVRAVGTLTGLEIEEGQITLYLLAPTEARYAAHKPDRQPLVALHQAELPSQPAAGVAVRALVEAQTTTESYRPYDYVWTGPGSPLLPVRGPRLEVTGKPTGRMGDPETVGKARVALIDAFGQVATADVPVLAHPAPRQRRTRRRVLQASVVAAVIAALTLAGVAIAGPGLGGFLGGGGATATATATATQAPVANFSMSPLTTMQVGCDSAAGTAAVSPIVLDNSTGGTDIPWQASITDQAPGGGEPWATFADGSQSVSGTVSAGQTQQLQVQPARDLCRRVFDTRAQQLFHVALTYTSSTAQQATVTVAVGISQVAVSVQTKVPQSKTGQTTLRQDCNNSANPVQAFSILLDGSQGTAATAYQIQISDPPPAASGLPTPTPGGSTVWATADSTGGTVPAGQQVTVTITPAPGLCNGVSQSQPSDLHVVVALGTGARSVTVTDTVEYIIP